MNEDIVVSVLLIPFISETSYVASHARNMGWPAFSLIKPPDVFDVDIKGERSVS
ncbi:hypothetical protein D3C84_952520 [compost metagenome]